ncbi:hypothetical protein CCM_00976 [Cordyceps militaris CM01]|uniref:Uncharacterized protein n=1 Tax=Cordyceps militaris (strain CM01) TaxID=983644 RepID=G3J7F0_CORMM|nr:uncharacterized protein CCM_00976 [Cordyceps militaris CM01]EGX96320.1 hypothetical protein CCM_00976 [Cordyceps militaris CM01]
MLVLVSYPSTTTPTPSLPMKGLFALVQAALVAVATAAAAHNAAAEECAGYNASDVRMYTHGGTADLRLAGKACNASGHDLEPLKLIVSYDTGKPTKYPWSSTWCPPSAGADRPSSVLRFDDRDCHFPLTSCCAATEQVLFHFSAPLVFDSQVLRLLTAPNLYGPRRAHSMRRPTTTAEVRQQDFELRLVLDEEAYAWTTGKAADQNGQTTLIPFSFKDGVLTTNDTFGYVTKSSICKVLVLGGDNKGSAANAKTSSSRDAAKLLGEI